MSFNPSQPRVPAGSAGGGRWGAARDSKAAKAQGDSRGAKVGGEYADLPPAKRRDYLKGLSDDDLQKLTGVVYSSRTSDPNVVAMRLAVAAEMGKRGFDVKKFGALGGGLPAKKPAGPPPSPTALRSALAKRAPAARGTAARASVGRSRAV